MMHAWFALQENKYVRRDDRLSRGKHGLNEHQGFEKAHCISQETKDFTTG